MIKTTAKTNFFYTNFARKGHFNRKNGWLEQKFNC